MLSSHYRQFSLLRGLFIPGFCVLLLTYFIIHAFSGNFGVNARLDLENRAALLQADLAEIKARRIKLAQEVKLLKYGNLDRDMVDERARYTLSMVRPDEIVISLARP